MKLILESWNKYLIEEEIGDALKQKAFKSQEQLKNFLHEEYNKRGIYLTEEQLNEVMPAFLAKLGAKAALMAQLAGAGGPSQQQYDTDVGGDADAPTQQAQAQIQQVGDVVDNGDGTFSITVEMPTFGGSITIAKRAGGVAGKAHLQNAGHDIQGASIDAGAPVNGVLTVTVTTAG